MDIHRSILKLIPDFKCVVWNNDYNQIEKHELELRVIPTLQELETVWPQVQEEINEEKRQFKIREAQARLSLFLNEIIDLLILKEVITFEELSLDVQDIMNDIAELKAE
jgi:hypothetical protein